MRWFARFTDVANNENAFSPVLKLYGPLALSRARRLLRKSPHADDIALAVLGGVWRERATFQSFQELKDFIFRQLKKNCNIRLQNFGRNWKVPANPKQNDLGSFLDSIEKAPFLNDIYIECMVEDLQKVAQLTPEYKWILLNSFGARKSDEELADELKTSVIAVRTRKSRAIRSLTDLFKDAYPLLIILLCTHTPLLLSVI